MKPISQNLSASATLMNNACNVDEVLLIFEATLLLFLNSYTVGWHQ